MKTRDYLGNAVWAEGENPIKWDTIACFMLIFIIRHAYQGKD